MATKNINPKIEEYLKSFEALSKSMDDYLFVWDIKNTCVYFFGDIDEKFAIRNPGEKTNTPQQMMAIVHEKDRHLVQRDMIKVMRGEKKEHYIDYRWIDRQGNIVWINCRGKVLDEEGEPMVLLGRVSKAPFENKYNKLTGVFNKRKMLQDAKEKEYLSKPGYFLMLGLDRLVKVYSKMGREYTDALIVSTAKILGSLLEENERLYQIEDDVFVVYLPEGNEERAEEIYEKVTEETQNDFTITGVGVPSSNKYFSNEEGLYETAMEQLKLAKKNNRAELSFLSKQALAEAAKAKELRDRLEQSVKNGFEGFYVCYQPQMKGTDYSIHGVEALMRFSLRGKEYFPNQFIPLLEQSGLMPEAGLWILRTALAQVKQWRKKLPNLCLNVNFSMSQLEEPDMAEKVIKLFNESGLPANTLTIELTETMKTGRLKDLSMITRAWKEVGIDVAIDDFGTGYSNLVLLKEIKCNEIKIERTFVTDIKKDTYGYLLINSVVNFAHEHGMRVCCEGTEKVEDVITLSALSPDLFQGYVFDKPCTEKDFEERYIKTSTKEYKERNKFRKYLTSLTNEQITRFDPSEILDNMGVGLCVLQFNLEKQEFLLHPDDTMKEVFAMAKDLTPLEYHDYWYTKIKEDYVDFVKKNLRKLLKTEKVLQFIYPWMHPEKGEIMISCSSTYEEGKDGYKIIKALHREVSIMERVGDETKKRPLRYFMQNKYLDIMLNNTIAFMEINLTTNRVDGGLKDMLGNQPELDCTDFVDEDGNLVYEEFEKWWADKYLLSSRQEFYRICNCKYLIDCYSKGEQNIEFYCRGKDRYGNVYDCKKVFFINKDEVLGDITALCVMYDVSEQIKEKIEFEHRNNAIRSICDDFTSILYVNLEEDSAEFYREDKTLGNWKENLRYSEMMNLFAQKFVTEKDRADFKYYTSISFLKNKLATEGQFCFEYERKCVDGKIRTHELKIRKDKNDASRTCAIFGVKNIENDVKLRNELKQALDLAYTDHLTGLYNQQGLAVKSTELLKNKCVKSAVMFMDLDNFKSVNDAYGHAMGDKVLVEVGRILKEETRGKDVVGRYGGDEFVALIYDIRNNQEAEEVMERISRSISNVCVRLGLSTKITASIGLSFTDQTGYDYRYLKEIADDRLYIAKKRGKNVVVNNS